MFFSTLNLYDETDKKGLNIIDELIDENIEGISQKIINDKINSLSIQNYTNDILHLETIAKLPKIQHLGITSKKVSYQGGCNDYFTDLKLFFLNAK